MNYSLHLLKCFTGIALWLISFQAFAFMVSEHLLTLPQDTPYQVCFSPQQNCTQQIVKLIDSAKHSIHMQAYSFTSRPITHALIAAVKRGVTVDLIVDHSQLLCQTFSRVRYLLHHQVHVWDDDKLNIAHNKVLIIDHDAIETGSFNYTTSAQKYNAENVLILYSPQLADIYLHNWQYRKEQSIAITVNSIEHCHNKSTDYHR